MSKFAARAFLGFLGFLALLAADVGASAEDTRAEIVRFGIYSGDTPTLAVATSTILIQKGIRFGLEFKAAGPPDDSVVKIKAITVFPPAGVKSPGVKQRLHQTASTVAARVGQPTFAGYRIGEVWQMAPGEWRIELWSGDRKLAEQKFLLVERAH